MTGATYYYLYGGCSTYASVPATGLTTTLAFPSNCGGATSPLRFEADDDSGTIATGYLPAATSTDGATVTLPAWNTFPAAPNFTTSVSGLDPFVQVNETDTFAVYSSIAQNQITYNTYSYDFTLTSGAGSLTSSIPTDGLRTMSDVYLFNSDNAIIYWNEIESLKAGPSATTTTAAFAKPAIPFISENIDHSIDGKLSWFTSSAGTADAAVGHIEWTVDDSGTGDGPYHYHQLTVIAPYAGQNVIDYSGFPAALAAQLPPAGTNLNNTYVQLVDLAGPTTYDQTRSRCPSGRSSTRPTP